MSNNWIKCSDRMPEKDGRYLVCEHWSKHFTWIGISSLRGGIWDCNKTTHWQELPEAPIKVDN